ncbi:hypothetical protein GCM10023188_16970 [Pontibacter saemangeumensis]|uniref:N-acetyltransferase domain-containing protein n=1 Tax=Pontibacter saemangeumensis TaxID=1084525 RepID=A0ABP8LL63_9BACT
MEINIVHEEKYQQFTVALGEEEAELAYALPAAGEINFTHTFVPENARGRGIANKLIREGLRYAEQNDFKVMATCPIVAAFLRQHTDYRKLLE